jgi:hypothetical protein
VIKENRGERFGAGIYNIGDLRIWNSAITANVVPNLGGALGGGGIANDGAVVIHGSVVAENRIGGGFSSISYGGGIYNNGHATIIHSTISGNRANDVSLNTVAGAGGGIYNHTAGVLIVQSSLIAHNQVSSDYDAYGGGIGNGIGVLAGGLVTVINSTIVGNLAFAIGDSYGYAQGGGISNTAGGTVVVQHSTIADNRSEGGAAYVYGSGGGIGGGRFNDPPGPVHLSNTIVADNSAKTEAADLHGSLASSGYNLFSNAAGGSGYAATDLLNVDPLLGPLQDNGGPTQTMGLLHGSPAIDAGDPNPEDPPEWDQRGPGFPRIVNGRLDIGAFEVQATGAPLPIDLLAVFATADFETKHLFRRD